MLAMVGSRNASVQGRANAQAFAEALSGAGLCIVSGLALGIDAAAHEGALAGARSGGGSTVAVIGTGPDLVYPARNRGLCERIAARRLHRQRIPDRHAPAAGQFPQAQPDHQRPGGRGAGGRGGGRSPAR